jgi:hypothetical protein
MALALAACASAPVPNEQIAAGRAAVEVAQSAGAGQYAPAELNAARDKLERAQQAIRADDNLTARRLAEAAEADARLAHAKSTSARSQAAVEEIERSLSTLQEELRRKQP